MEPKIITKGHFPIIGIELKTTTKEGKNFKEIPQFWQKVLSEGLIEKIPDKKYPYTTLGICTDFNDDGSFSYIIGAEVNTTDNVPDGMVAKTILESKYAVFTARGQMPQSIQETVKFIYNEWFPNSKYMYAGDAEFELYDERCCKEEDPEVDIYIPVTEK